jgi:hypothetical protein
MRPSRFRRACWTIALAAAAAGGVTWFLPVPADVAPAPPITFDTSGVVPSPGADPAIAEDIAMANVFAASRTPPPTRFVPPEFSGDSATGAIAEPMPEAAMAGEYEPGDEVPRLYGTVVGPEGPKALLHLDPATTFPRLYTVGDADGGYRVVSIVPRAVVLRGPRGRVTLRLDPEEDRP